MINEEVLKAVFPFLEAVDLVSCMRVCGQWRDIALEDYFWKCLCAKKWPSICKKPKPPIVTYYKLYKSFHKRQNRILPPPRISFDDLEFYIDIWIEGRLIFSEAVPGPALQSSFKILPSGICDKLRTYLDGPDYKMTLPVEPRFTVLTCQAVSVSVLVGRKDSNEVACIINNSMLDYIDRTAFRAMAFDYLDFAPVYPFSSSIRAWVSLLFMEDGSSGGDDGALDVFGIQLDFCDAANSKEEVLWLLDMLDWK